VVKRLVKPEALWGMATILLPWTLFMTVLIWLAAQLD
jgi:hypothetical protein